MIRVKRVYEKASKDDGYRVLVDRVWPRGVSKAHAHAGEWMKEIAPSTGLRKWFGHVESRWTEFRKRYRKELANQGERKKELKRLAKKHGTLTLVYSAKDTEHNQAVVLAEWLRE